MAKTKTLAETVFTWGVRLTFVSFATTTAGMAAWAWLYDSWQPAIGFGASSLIATVGLIDLWNMK